jgi:protease secretion system membrane fusion protein
MSDSNIDPNKQVALSSAEKELSKTNALVVQFKEIDKKVESWVQSWNPYHPSAIRKRAITPVAIQESRANKQIAWFIIIAFGVFLIWAFVAPLDKGVTTQGTVMVSGYDKQLQHPTGGLIQEILVKEGDHVNEGDVLIRINPLKAEADLSVAQLQYINILASEARLQAERRGDKQITWPEQLNSLDAQSKIVEAKDVQQKLFETRRKEFLTELNAKRTNASMINNEYLANEQLAKEGFVSRSQANQILRTKLDADNAVSSTQSVYMKDIDTQLSTIQANRDALKDKFEAVSFDRDLTSLRAPISGTVIGLKVNTVGGTVPGGQVLAEIVPEKPELIVEAKVPTNLIDQVRVGIPADMRFTAFNVNTTPIIEGKVVLVGADVLKGEGGKGGDTYLAKVEATPEGLEKMGDLKILPGMTVDVVFKTGERTFMGYLFKPIIDRLALSFK